MNSAFEITHLDRTRLDEAVAILARAFARDPVMRQMFAPSPLPESTALMLLFRYSCEVRLLLDWPLLGCRTEEGRLVGVAGLSLPGEVIWPSALVTVYEELTAAIGSEATARMEAYARLADTNRPADPHFQLGMIGVDPGWQGHGYGAALLQATHEMSRQHPASTGVWLDTESPENVAWYRSFGYEVRAESHLDNVTIWGMFRPEGGAEQ